MSLAGEGAARELVAADGSRAPIDVVLPVLHGPMGEDGAVQGMFELADVPYVGAGVLGSAIGMDKAIQKVLFVAAGLPVGPWDAVREPEWLEDPEGVAARVAALGYPVFVKPATLGSSVGITKAHDPGELDASMAEAFGSPGRLSWSTGSRLRERSNARCSATTTRSHPSAARSFPRVTSSTTTPRSTSTPGARASTFLPTSIPRCRRASNAWR